MNENRYLIINADDFGLSPGTNEAIIACYLAGSVSSTTLMVNMTATEEATRLARRNRGLGVGLHFNLTCGRPLSPPDHIKSLVDSDGIFYERSVAEKKALSRQFNSDEIFIELSAQWNHMVSSGLIPTHLDSHQHIHTFPIAFDVVAAFCVEHNIPVRIPTPWKPPNGATMKRRARMWMLKKMISRNMNHWGERLATNASFASIFDFQLTPDEISMDKYRDILKSSHHSPLEVMIHPSVVDDEHECMTNISSVSRKDYDIFSNTNFGDIARDMGYELINYLNLMK